MLRTGGPWTFESCGGVMVVHGKDVIGADCHVCEHPRTEGDGHLIAAAPDLLEALAALTELGCTHTSPLDPNTPHELLIAARKAISKAEGG